VRPARRRWSEVGGGLTRSVGRWCSGGDAPGEPVGIAGRRVIARERRSTDLEVGPLELVGASTAAAPARPHRPPRAHSGHPQPLSAAHRHATIQVDGRDGTAWPWAFYLRDLPVQYTDMRGPFTPDADIVVVDDSDRARVLPHLAGYTGSRFHLREWWVVDWRGASMGDAFRWLARREAWSATGTLDQWLYVRMDRP
jgi:hypothetical protein